VKNLALAVQMYLADNNDTLWPREHRSEVADWFRAAQPGNAGSDTCWSGSSAGDKYISWGNPYLRVPVILDEYVKNRDVWRCPSAKAQSNATFILPGPDWFNYLRTNQGNWGESTDIGGPLCLGGWPPGWGGEVTDSIVQQTLAGGTRDDQSGAVNKAFVFSIGIPEYWVAEKKLAAVQDPVRHPIVGPSGVSPLEVLSGWGVAAYPDICCAECAGIAPFSWGWGGAAAGINACPDGSGCPDCYEMHAVNVWWNSNGYDVEARKAAARHLGGVNIGFLDGHANWIASERLMAQAGEGEYEWPDTTTWCVPTKLSQYEGYCGSAPDPRMVFLY
jgi:prepilin-type processing-associated H-X9-DG protein